MGETPVPIPNTKVKTQAADGTALETVWESRWPPDSKKENKQTELDRVSFGESLRSGQATEERFRAASVFQDRYRHRAEGGSAANPISRAVLLR